MWAKAYDEAEVAFIKKNFDRLTYKELAASVSFISGNTRTVYSIKGLMFRKSLKKSTTLPPRWSEDEKSYLWEIQGTNTLKEIVTLFRNKFDTERSERTILKNLQTARHKNKKTTIVSGPKVEINYNESIGINPKALIMAMGCSDVLPGHLSNVISDSTGLSMTGLRVTDMMKHDGMPERYASVEVKKLLGID